MTTCSPYACGPVAINCGLDLVTYWVPKHLLRSPRWSSTDAGGTLCLPGVSAATGHTLVHYLYTGTYQTLEAKGEDAMAPAHIELKQALLTFVLASAYELQDLESLAKEQIETYGSRMALVQVLGTVKEEFSKMTWCWFHEYLQVRADEQFELDFTIFKSKAFNESVGEGTLHRFMTSHLLERFSEELAHTLQRQGGYCLDKEKPDIVLEDVEDAAVKTHHRPCYHGGHQTGMCAASDDMSFEFPNVPCEGVDDVISLGNSVWDETDHSSSELEPMPPPEPQPEPVIEPEPTPTAEEKPAEEWDDWVAAAALVDKSKKKEKGVVEEEPPHPPPEPEAPPEPEPEPEPIQKLDEDDPRESAAFNISKKMKKSKRGALVPDLASPPPEMEPELPPMKEIEPPPLTAEDDMWLYRERPLAAMKKKKSGEVVEDPLPKTASKESGKSAKDVVEDLISLDDPPPVDEKEKKKSKISSMLSAFGGGTVKHTSKKETPTERRVRERRERKEREGQERINKENVVREEEQIAREAEESGAAKQARIEAEEVEAARVAEEEAEAARIAAEEAEAARLAAEEEIKRTEEEEEEEEEVASKSTGEWAASLWGSSKKKEPTKETKAREKREKEVKEENERLAQGEGDRLAAEEEARIAAGELEAARIAEEEAETAQIAAEEEERKKKEGEEAASKSTGRGLFGSRKKETTKARREREAKERLAQEVKEAEEAAEAAAAAAQAQRETEEAKAAEAALLAPVSSKEKKKTKKKKKGEVVMEEEPPAPLSLSPAPEDANADLFDMIKDTLENQLGQELGGDLKTEPIPETSSTLCPWLSSHILDGNRWRSCERCYTMLRGIADQLVEEKNPVLL
jgi:hypothetical protein